MVSDGDPISVAPVQSEELVPGPASDMEAFYAIKPWAVISEEEVPGPQPPFDQQVLGPIAPYSVPSAETIPGPWVEPAEPEDPTIASLFRRRALHVDGYPLAAEVQCQPVQNDVGTGSFVVYGDDKPELDEVVGFNIGSRRIFSGRVVGYSDVELSSGDEADMARSVDVEGRLSEWRRAVIMPDFGARNAKYLRRPTQDDRAFDWTMNGIGTYAGYVPPYSIRYGRSIGYDVTEAARTFRFPLPDVWPDPTAKWMWVSSPNKPRQPRGWCYFRVPTPSRRAKDKIQFWACAHDYAEVWVDGVLILVCDTPGVAKMIELDATAHASHLVAIRAYTRAGGPAGVLFSMLPVNGLGLYDPPIMNSRSNWYTQAYPSRPFRMTPGAVLIHLKYEALWRGVENIPDWEYTFDARYDSAGRPWPMRDEPQLIMAAVGMTYLDFLMSLTEDRLDFVADPYRRKLSCFVKDYGKNGLGAPPFVAGSTMTSKTLEERYQ